MYLLIISYISSLIEIFYKFSVVFYNLIKINHNKYSKSFINSNNINYGQSSFYISYL